MIEIEIDYPEKRKFKGKRFPPFDKYGDVPRTQYLHFALKHMKVEHPGHDIEDFIVEDVKKTKTGEFWVVGS